MNISQFTGTGVEIPMTIIAGVILVVWYLIRRSSRGTDE